jgi:peptide/nickel transport system permease protein
MTTTVKLDELKEKSRFQMPSAVYSLIRSPMAILGFFIVAGFLFVAFFAPYIAPHDYDLANLSMVRKGPSAEYILGNDELGRDLLSRLIHGAQISLTLGLISVGIHRGLFWWRD